MKENVRKYVVPQLVLLAVLSGLIFAYFIPDIFIKIRPGQAGVLYRLFFGGTVTDKVYGEGLTMIFPWDDMYVYDVRTQQRTVDLTALTKDGLSVRVRASVSFHPELPLLGVLHQRVGPEYEETLVEPEVASDLRVIVGTYTAEELYQTSAGALSKLLAAALSRMADNYVVVDDVALLQMELPDSVREAIEAKENQRHLAQSYTSRIEVANRESERRRIEAEGIARANQIVAQSLDERILKLRGIEATKELATSQNAKVVVVGNGPNGMPIILGADK